MVENKGNMENVFKDKKDYFSFTSVWMRVISKFISRYLLFEKNAEIWW